MSIVQHDRMDTYLCRGSEAEGFTHVQNVVHVHIL